MPTPAADIDVDEALVRRLLRAERPDLAALPVRLVANGWDNAVFRLGDRLAVRVPRRLVAADLVRHEQEALPAIARRTTVAVPAPIHAGAPGPDLPFPWSIVPWFAGRTVAEEPVADQRRLADDLAAFLRSLHVPDPAAPVNPVRGVQLRDRAADLEARFADPHLALPAGLRPVWAAALAAPGWAGPPIRLHGDLHPGNLVAREGRLAAVIDFGDTTCGDPATDAATAWLTFDAGGRERFRAALRPDRATWDRARGWAAVMGSALLATEPGSVMHRVGAAAIDRVLEVR